MPKHVVTAVCVDNGEPTLEQCIQSLRNQTERVKVVVATGPKTNAELAKSLADEVIGPFDRIGVARIAAILKHGDDIIISCDADSIYDPRYAEYALEDLRGSNSVKAGSIYPLPGHYYLESIIEPNLLFFMPYEFSLAFKRSLILSRLPSGWEQASPRWDIGMLTVPFMIDNRMRVWTRLPTYYGTRIIAGVKLAGVGAAAALPLLLIK
jgi:glycosyltransferase involved in cell wall biosynthesis